MPKLSPEDKAEIDASLARSDYIVEHHKRKFKEDVDSLIGEVTSTIWFVRGLVAGGLITSLTILAWNVVYQLLR